MGIHFGFLFVTGDKLLLSKCLSGSDCLVGVIVQGLVSSYFSSCFGTPCSGSKMVPLFSWIQMAKDLVLISLRYATGGWRIEAIPAKSE